MELYVNMLLLTLMAAITVAIIVERNLFSVVILAGIYSFLMASVMMVLDAPDVAMTEASVGAGVSTVFLLTTLYLTRSREMKPQTGLAVPLLVSAALVAILVYGTFGLPGFGDPTAPVHAHVGPFYLENSIPQTTVPNVVTSVLATYRSFDTLGEATVVFTGAIGVLLLLRSGKGPSADSNAPTASAQRSRAPRDKDGAA
ncbi:MAG: DUF4040 domain-containing protein [Pseudomonadota bacterium]